MDAICACMIYLLNTIEIVNLTTRQLFMPLRKADQNPNLNLSNIYPEFREIYLQNRERSKLLKQLFHNILFHCRVSHLASIYTLCQKQFASKE